MTAGCRLTAPLSSHSWKRGCYYVSDWDILESLASPGTSQGAPGMETPRVHRQHQPRAMGTAGPPSSQQASRKPAMHTGVRTQLHPGAGNAVFCAWVTPNISLLTQGPAGPGTLWVLQCLP